ncbi:DNA polymerase III subunit delta [Buchnera aphidicola (Pterocallis alni)]|uniref:hypothetical protein n=1 Tax=Buchnera aphidicola TaxID=9 RepID=UPI003463AC36
MNIYIKPKKVKKILLKNFYYNYLIIENNFMISQEIQEKIIKHYNKKKYNTIIQLQVTSKIDFKKIYYEYQQKQLFIKKKILFVTVQHIINTNIINSINILLNYGNNNIILVFILPDLQCRYMYLLNGLNNTKIIIISCNNISKIKNKIWIIKQTKKMNLHLKNPIIKILSYYYENNLFMLFKILQILKIINPKKITTQYIKNIIEDSVYFTFKQLLYSLLLKKKIQYIRILNFFQKNNYNILSLLRYIQKKIILLIELKNKYKKNTTHNIQKKNKFILENINQKKIYKIIHYLQKIEQNIKKYDNDLIWIYFKMLITII